MDRPAVRIEAAPLEGELAQSLIAELNAELTHRYPEDGATHFRLDPAEVEAGRGAFLVAFVDGAAVGCGAVRLLEDKDAEIKRMYVRHVARGQGIARELLAALEGTACELGARRLVLETGARQPEANGLYAGAGFTPIPPFGEYVDSPMSLCFGKPIAR